MKTAKRINNNLDRIITENLNKLILTEINHFAEKSPITICSLEEFVEICSSLNVNDSNVDDYFGQICFIEIGSSRSRCNFDFEYSDSDMQWGSGDNFYENGQFYFKSNHSNVLRLEFDDNIKIGSSADDENNGMNTPIRLSKREVSPRHWNEKWGEGYKPTFRYDNAKAFTYEMAKETSSFIDNNISASDEPIRFVIHCRQGRSRSASLGYYLAKKLEQDIKYKINIGDYFSEYDINYDDGTKSNQFNIHQTSANGGKLMNHRVSSIMFDYDANKDDYEKHPEDYTYIKRNKGQGMGRLVKSVYKDKYKDAHDYSTGKIGDGRVVSKRRK